jgi:hypothetical protein
MPGGGECVQIERRVVSRGCREEVTVRDTRFLFEGLKMLQ